MVCRLGVVAGLVLALVFGVAGSAGAQPAAGVDLVPTVSLDRDAYLPGDEVRLTLRVANHGDTAAEGVVAHVVANVPLTDSDMRGFYDGGAGFGEFVGAGLDRSETYSFVLPAVVRPVLEFTVSSQAADANPANDKVSVAVPVPGALASVDGVLFGDKDLDGTADAGEALTGVQMSLYQDADPWRELTVRSGPGGRFEIPELVIGTYRLWVELPPGWQVDDPSGMPELRIGPGANSISVRAVRDVKPTLDVSVRFDRASYAVGDVIHEHVRITNTGTADLSGITALCTGPGNPNELTSAHWGDLASYTGAGVTVRAGQTREFTFTDVVPQGGYDYGGVHLECTFAPNDDHRFGVYARAEAAVPGGRGDLTGTVYLRSAPGSADEEVLPKVKVYIVNRAGKIAARSVTDAQGRFLFSDVPAGRYELRFVGPWRYAYSATQFWNVVAGQTRTIDLQVVSGPNQPDPDAPPPDPGTPAPSTSDDPPRPQARAAGGGLADTGADVKDMAGLGIGLLLVGFWLLVLPTRARREP